MPVTIHPKGTTINHPDKCYNGYTAVLLPREAGPAVALIDMNGNPVHYWQMEGWNNKGGVKRARLLPNGRLLILRGSGKTTKACVHYGVVRPAAASRLRR